MAVVATLPISPGLDTLGFGFVPQPNSLLDRR
jgi:hypothetical protein